MRVGPELDRRLMRLGAHMTDQRRGKHLQHVLDPLRERPLLLGIEQHDLLFHPDAIGKDRGVPLRPLSLRRDPGMIDERAHDVFGTIRPRTLRRLGRMSKQAGWITEIASLAQPRFRQILAAGYAACRSRVAPAATLTSSSKRASWPGTRSVSACH